MPSLRFNVFGQLVQITGAPGNWTAWLLGADGKRRPADFIVPDFVTEDDMEQYLFDLFHESATPTNGSVFRLD